MKGYTDLPQSKKLAEFLPLESADMCYPLPCGDGDKPLLEQGDFGSTPCWSLSALLEIIPQEIFDGEYIINITEGRDEKWVITYDHRENRNHCFYGLSSGADNLVDACVEMVQMLHERKLL